MLKSMHLCNYLQFTHLYSFGGGKKFSIKNVIFWKYFFSFSMHLLFFLYYIHMRLNEVSNIHIYKIKGNKILKIWDLKLICKTAVHLHLHVFQVTVVPCKLKYVVTLRKNVFWIVLIKKIFQYFQYFHFISRFKFTVVPDSCLFQKWASETRRIYN